MNYQWIISELPVNEFSVSPVRQEQSSNRVSVKIKKKSQGERDEYERKKKVKTNWRGFLTSIESH